MWAVADQAELVSRAQGADQWAFAELMRRTTGASLRLATGMLKNHHLAEDEVQNAYFKVWQHIHQFQGGALFSTWMSRIVVNQCLMQLRRLRQSRLISIEGAVASDGGARPLDLADRGPNAETKGFVMAVTGVCRCSRRGSKGSGLRGRRRGLGGR